MSIFKMFGNVLEYYAKIDVLSEIEYIYNMCIIIIVKISSYRY